MTRYWKAAASVSVIGALVANFITKLHEYKGAQPERFHIIGHSLGAHISGVVGHRIGSIDDIERPQIARITGLDPAGPCFFKLMILNRHAEEYLDKSDATVVETIHTNGADLGYINEGYPISHYEFYLNGGKRQPGCKKVIGNLVQIISDGSGE